jgi:hypothetical protein
MKQIKLKTFIVFLALESGLMLQAEDGKGNAKNPGCGQTRETAVIQPTVPDKPNVISFSGGGILSRVVLKSTDDLSPYADKKASGYNQQKKDLAGLLVFHTGGGNSGLPKGMYVWDGDKWQKVSYDF